MNALLICPADRPAVARLAEACPLAVLPVFGQSLVEYWLQYLALRGARRVLILAVDRPDQVRAVVGDGARWGLQIQLSAENRELTPAEAHHKYNRVDDPAGLNPPVDVVVMDHLPGLPEHRLFDSYRSWFDALQAWMPRPLTPARIGQVEVQPGVWIGLRSRVASTAQLRAPCWLGENVFVGPGAIVGPNAILENCVFVEADANVVHSVIGPQTFVGALTLVKDSLACGNTLINWKTNSSLDVPDDFLLCSLGERRGRLRPASLFGRGLALATMIVTAPLTIEFVLRSIFSSKPVFQKRLGVRPGRGARSPDPATFAYYELADGRSGLRRWPQLWSIVCGDLAWIGNRPLQPREALALVNDFERLWLSGPAGLISLADAEGCSDGLSEAACAHASFFAVRANHRLRWSIFRRGLRRALSQWIPRFRLARGIFSSAPAQAFNFELGPNQPGRLPTQINYEN
jgi:hypothetical protein